MKRLMFIVLSVFLFSGCATTDPQLNATLEAMKQDYLSGKMSKEKYLSRVEAIKHHVPNERVYHSQQPQTQQIKLQQEKFYREWESFYVRPQEQKHSPQTNCFRDLDGGITCQKHVY